MDANPGADSRLERMETPWKDTEKRWKWNHGTME